MADVNLLASKILKWEGGFVDDPTDHGGATNMGITLTTYRAVFGEENTVNDLKTLTKEQFAIVLKKYYWDRWKADQIANQSIANILVDWVWGSGVCGIKIPQRILGVNEDGVVGAMTIKAINDSDQKELFDRIWHERWQFLYNIVNHDNSQERFIKGWINRLNDFKFETT